VTLFPGKPTPVPVRAADARNRASAQWGIGFRLPALEKIKVGASMIVPSGVASRGRGMELWDDAPKECTVEDILDHGTDFDRITTF